MTKSGGRSRTARRASALPFAAAIVAAALLGAACGAPGNAPLRAVAGGASVDGPVFPFFGAMRSADSAFDPFVLASDARLRAAIPAADGILAWSHGDDTLRLYRTDGTVAASWPLEAATVWAGPAFLLARDELYAEGGGFGFALHAFDETDGPRKLASWNLDCFPADLAFVEGGVLLAGADLADRAHSVRLLGSDGGARTLFEFPKRDDFARFVAEGGKLVVFASARERGKRELEAYLVDLLAGGAPGTAAARLELRGLPEGALCWYGSGFHFGGRFWLPLAMSGGDTALAGFRLDGAALLLEALVRDSLGVYAPLGPSADGSVFRYLAYDHEREPGAWRLAAFDGEAIESGALNVP